MLFQDWVELYEDCSFTRNDRRLREDVDAGQLAVFLDTAHNGELDAVIQDFIQYLVHVRCEPFPCIAHVHHVLACDFRQRQVLVVR